MRNIICLFTFFSIILPLSLSPAFASEKESVMILELSTGVVKIRLRDDLAPKHVERMKQLADLKFYDNIIFHRVIDGFMAQTGDPTGTGMGGSDYPDLRAEFSPEPFLRGTIGMARSQHPDSANSQFFICFDGCGHLTGQYTVWGQVERGMDSVENLAAGEPPRNRQCSTELE